MARHAGPGPFPAVVLLHGCGGYHSSMMSWTDRLAAWGYVALSVDSFGRARSRQRATARLGIRRMLSRRFTILSSSPSCAPTRSR
jgi:dienelactone hydrolase